jgi:hypothetical protein
LDIFENIFKYLEIFLNIWKYLKIFGNTGIINVSEPTKFSFGKYLKTFENI